MKSCPYCGERYSDDVVTCPVDQQLLVHADHSRPQSPAEAGHKVSVEEEDFWRRVSWWKALFFLWWIGWLPFGFVGVEVSKHYFGDSPYCGYAMLGLWFIGWQLILARLKTLPCPHCG